MTCRVQIQVVNAFQDPAYIADQQRKRLSTVTPPSRSVSVVTPPPAYGSESTRAAVRNLIAQERAARDRYFSSPMTSISESNAEKGAGNGGQV